MPRMTFTKTFDKATGQTTAVHYQPGQTYDVAEDLVAEIVASGAGAPVEPVHVQEPDGDHAG
jgi:hypothetical protein